MRFLVSVGCLHKSAGITLPTDSLTYSRGYLLVVPGLCTSSRAWDQCLLSCSPPVVTHYPTDALSLRLSPPRSAAEHPPRNINIYELYHCLVIVITIPLYFHYSYFSTVKQSSQVDHF